MKLQKNPYFLASIFRIQAQYFNQPPGYCASYLNRYTSKDQCIYSFVVPKKDRDQCPGLQNDMETLNTEFKEIQNKMEELKNTVKLIQSNEASWRQIGTLEGKIGELEQIKVNLERENTRLENEIMKYKAQIDDLMLMNPNGARQDSSMLGSRLLGSSNLLNQNQADCSQYIENIEIYKQIEEQAILAQSKIEELTLENSKMKVNSNCNEYHKPLPSCDAIYNLGYRRSGPAMIDPDGEGGHDPFLAYCDFESNPIVTRVEHDKMDGINVVGCDDPGCFKIQIDYGAPSAAVKVLVQNSLFCSQHIRYDCVDSKLLRDDNAYWVSVEKTKQRYWGGVHDEDINSCACGLDYTCSDPNYKCNCDADSELPLSDEGVLIDGQVPPQNANPNMDPLIRVTKNKLPVTGMAFGDVDAARGESGKATLGPLKCYFSTNKQFKNFPTSCMQLRALGAIESGYYWVDEDGKLGNVLPQRVFCQLSTSRKNQVAAKNQSGFNNNGQPNFSSNYPTYEDYPQSMGNPTYYGNYGNPGSNSMTTAKPNYDQKIFILTSCGVQDFKGPEAKDCNSTYTGTNMENADYQVKDGIQYFIVKQTGRYKIIARAPAGRAPAGSDFIGRGATTSAVFTLKEKEELRILVGQKSGTESTEYFGGSGGTFVTKYKDYVYTPLLISGGGGSSSHPANNNLTVTDANTAKVGKDSSKLGLNFGHGGGEQQGGQRGGARFGAGTSGGGAGFHGDGTLSADTRWGQTFPAISFMKQGNIQAHKSSGLGGKFLDKGKISVNGGFGGGGSGGRWACGGGGGYSGGGGGPDSGHAGGGGSYVNEMLAEDGYEKIISVDHLGDGEVIIERV